MKRASGVIAVSLVTAVVTVAATLTWARLSDTSSSAPPKSKLCTRVIDEVNSPTGNKDPEALDLNTKPDSGGARWRMTHETELDDVYGITANSPRDVWVFGGNGKGRDRRHVIQWWDGSQWHNAELPGPATPGVIESSSRENVWLMAEVWAHPNRLRGSHDHVTVSLHWDGARWTCATIGQYRVSDIAVMNSRDVWAVGSPEDGGEPYAMHWKGASWRKAPIPEPLAVIDATPRSQMWALPGGSEPVSDGFTVWDWWGQEWTHDSTGYLVPPPNNVIGDGELFDITSLPHSDFWAVGHVHWGKPYQEESPERSRSLLVNYDEAFLGRVGEKYVEVAPDGAGGIWMITGTGDHVHRAHDGTVSRFPAPELDGADHVSVSQLTNIGGTTCMLAAVAPEGSPGDPVIEAYTPGETGGSAPGCLG